MEQKEIICRLLTALRENNDHSKKMHDHLARFDVDTDLFADSPLDNAVCRIVTSVIDDTHLLSWWIYGDRAFYGFLTIRMDETTVMDFIKYAIRYFITTQQHYEWR